MSTPVSTQAVLLKRVNHAEADRVVVFLTPQNGRVSAYAKGVRKPKSKLAGGLELCMVSDVVYIPSKKTDGLATITSARMKKYYSRIVSDYDSLQELFTILKIVEKASEYEVDSHVMYTLITEAMEGYESMSTTPKITTSWFIVNLSQMQGQGIMLERPLNEESFMQGARYSFDFEEMGFLEDPNGGLLANDIKLLKVMLASKSPKNLRNIVNIHEATERMSPIIQHITQQMIHM